MGSKEWSAKVQSLRDFEHPNVIKLIGLCAVGGESGIEPHRLLVYEFMQNKSLEDHLFSHAFPPLPWKIRLQIILGAAQGLAYLHEGLQVEVIHGCVKPSNVLLDDKLNPKLSFGLVQNPTMDGHGDDLPQYARVIWINSAAPEYIATGHLTYKTDVWCFGVLLYEILSGRRSIDHNRPKSEQILVQWVKQFPTNGERFGCIMDPRLGNRYSIGAAREIAKLADTCLSTIRKERPKMSGVVKRLERIIQASKEPPTPRHLK
ncbi:hypothetical protein V6N11_015598 [Hibiscus sabdariffa]|uniref:Protein kinase domain-containing protein n=1 Tax=Hibiscus sabdariffa TaxID=183260 RepID=A0ABR2TSR1_9ROSI